MRNNDLIEKELNVKDMIYEINGKQVMIDSDLAILYGVETKRINEAVNRNKEKFPERFSWILTKEETAFCLRSQIATLNKNNNLRGQHYKYLPRVFTEQGIAMLSTILKSKVAIEVSIRIMDTFVAMRKYINNNLIEQKYINNLVLELNSSIKEYDKKINEHDNTIRKNTKNIKEHDKSIKLLQETWEKLEEKEKFNHIFFEGQIYDAYSLLLDILNKSKNEIVIIDNYAGKELLDILRNIDKKIKIVSKNINEELMKKYSSQYSNIEFIINNSFHDRFIIIDKSILYHCGSSFKDLGKKCFGINKIEDTEIIKMLINIY